MRSLGERLEALLRLWWSRGRRDSSEEEGPERSPSAAETRAERGEAPDPELLEFLRADAEGPGADPAFKEALRQELWDELRQRTDRTLGRRR